MKNKSTDYLEHMNKMFNVITICLQKVSSRVAGAGSSPSPHFSTNRVLSDYDYKGHLDTTSSSKEGAGAVVSPLAYCSTGLLQNMSARIQAVSPLNDGCRFVSPVHYFNYFRGKQNSTSSSKEEVGVVVSPLAYCSTGLLQNVSALIHAISPLNDGCRFVSPVHSFSGNVSGEVFSEGFGEGVVNSRQDSGNTDLGNVLSKKELSNKEFRKKEVEITWTRLQSLPSVWGRMFYQLSSLSVWMVREWRRSTVYMCAS